MARDLKTLTRRWFDEVWNQGRLETIEEMLSPDVVGHGISEEPLCGLEGFKKFYQMYRAAFTEGEVTLHECISEGDTSACCFTFLAKHTGNGLGFPATGKEIAVSGMCMVRWRDGKIVEAFNGFDQLGLLRQLEMDNRRITP